MDDPEYIKGVLRKTNFYEAAGIFPGDQLLCTFESSDRSLDTRNLNALLYHRFDLSEQESSFCCKWEAEDMIYRMSEEGNVEFICRIQRG